MLRNLCGVPCKWYVFSAVHHDYLVISLLLHSLLSKFVCHPPVRSFLTGAPPHDENPGSRCTWPLLNHKSAKKKLYNQSNSFSLTKVSQRNKKYNLTLFFLGRGCRISSNCWSCGQFGSYVSAVLTLFLWVQVGEYGWDKD